MSAVGRIGGVGRLGLVAAAVRQFDPRREFFSNAEQGVWYDPSDLSTLFQDSAGTTPVTAVDQPVGLMLDKSKGLVQGAELYAGGAITGAPIGGPAFTNYMLAITSEVGKVYRFSINVSGYAGSNTYSVGGIFGTDWVVASVARTGNGLWTFTLIALRASPISLFTRSTNTANFSDISVKELPGNHATQSTATARPAYRASPQRVNFDGVDDVHVTTFPASLGSNCTIARAIPGVGASILTSQTIGTSYANTLTHAGMLIIDRALTAAETAKLTAYLNSKAGV